MVIRAVSIIIPSYNRPIELEKLLGTICTALQKTADLSYEIIIVSNGTSAENQYKYRYLADSHNCQLLKSAKALGPSMARNKGAAQASFDWLLFFDDDLLVAEDYFLELCALELAADCVCIDGITEVDKSIESILYGNASLTDFVGGFGTGNILYRKSDFWAIGGFDHNYFVPFVGIYFREDTDLGLRMMKRGSVVLAKQLRTFHPHGSQRDSFFFLRDASKYYFESYFRFKHTEWRDWVGSAWQQGSLGTWQTRGFLSDLLLLLLLAALFLRFYLLWLLFWLVYALLAFVLFRKSGHLAFKKPWFLLLVLPYAFVHTVSFWLGFFILRFKKPDYYNFN